jgi:hypothetical protein
MSEQMLLGAGEMPLREFHPSCENREQQEGQATFPAHTEVSRFFACTSIRCAGLSNVRPAEIGSGRKRALPGFSPDFDHLTPKTEFLEHSDAGCKHYNDVQNCLDASCHWNIGVDKPQNDSHNDQPQHDVHYWLYFSWHWNVSVGEPCNHRYNGQYKHEGE